MTKKINISESVLRNLYLKQNLSTYKIARKFDCDPSVVQKRLNEYNIKIRYPKKRIDISKKELKNLYWNKNLSSYKIAKLLRVGRTTIYNKLIAYNIKTRPKKIVNISREKLRELYLEKRLPLSKIAELYNCSHSVILNKMEGYNLARRDRFESNVIYPKQKFRGDSIKKAYMIGFRLGDLHVRRDVKDSSIIKVGGNTTKLDQFNLIKEVYGRYGHFWFKKYGEIYNICIQLDKSFKFLLPKEDKIPSWILKNNKYFFAFLGGYTDAEGNISVSQRRARFRIRTYDKNILFQIYNKLNSLGINAKFGLACKKGVHCRVKHNKDCWGIFVNSKKGLLKLFKFLKPYIKHKKRYGDLLIAERNIIERIKKKETKVIFMRSKKTFYITTPIYYTNSDPHVGSAYTTIAADILARWHRLLGEEVFFLTGTDEHGQKIQEIAEEKGIKPKEFVDSVARKFIETFKLLNISNDNFIRTTNKGHEEEVKKVLQKLYDKKFIYKGEYEACYCIGCEQYLNKSDLVDGKCPLHKKEPEIIKEESYIFKLSAFQDKLLELIKEGKFEILPIKKRNEMISFISGGLEDVSISRKKTKVYWGVELPFDKEHTCYVWVDAFWNYLTGIQEKKVFHKFWPPNVQLMANDILRVHSTIWPALLLALDYKLPKTLFIHGYFTVNGQKMSKSLGNAILPNYLIEKYGTDSLRYFLIRNIPFGQDGDYSEDILIERNNTELANKLGNLVSRVTALAEKNSIEKTTNKLLKKLDLKAIEKLIDNYELDKALTLIFAFIDNCNEYVQEKKLWETKDKKALYELVDSIKAISILLWPFMPNTSEKIAKELGFEIKYSEIEKPLKIKNISKGEILFKKI